MVGVRPWQLCRDKLPPEGELVETRSVGGLIQPLRRCKRLWFVADGSMYVYYEVEAWRYPAAETTRAKVPVPR